MLIEKNKEEIKKSDEFIFKYNSSSRHPHNINDLHLKPKICKLFNQKKRNGPEKNANEFFLPIFSHYLQTPHISNPYKFHCDTSSHFCMASKCITVNKCNTHSLCSQAKGIAIYIHHTYTRPALIYR